jgi:Integrase core domain
MDADLTRGKANELLHFDFVFVGSNISCEQYILVLNDDMSSYVWLRACEIADGPSALSCIVEWCSSFGVLYDWASDQGRHFVNNLMQAAARQLRVKHRFTTAYSP